MYGRALGHQSVPQAIKTILASNDLYLEALVSGIANYTALAHKFKPDVEKITGIEVQLGTIVVAIKRFADTLVKEKQEKEESIMPSRMDGARMSLTGSIIDVDIDFNDTEFDQIFNMLDEVFENESSGYNLFHTNKQLTLLTEDVEEIRNIVLATSKKFNGKITEGLSKITITLPSSTVASSDKEPQQQRQKPYYNVLSLVSDVLYNNQISLNNAFFAPNDIVIILNSKDAAKAYDLLRAKISPA
jgi:hypothetical protein